LTVSSLWDVKYHPKKLSDLCAITSLENKFKQMLKNKDVGIPLLLYGPPGHGKTTIGEIFARMWKKMGGDYKILNGSKERKIDDVRNIIDPFVKTKKSAGVKKLCIIDESDRLTTESLDAIKALQVSYSHNCSFIFMTNHIERFPPASLSRFSKHSLIPGNPKEIKELKIKFAKRLMYILDQENVKYDKKIIGKHIQNQYPDFRQTILTAQDASQMYGKIDENILNMSTGFNEELLVAMKTKDYDAIMEVAKEINPDYFYQEFYRQMKKNLESTCLPSVLSELGYGNIGHNKCASKEINLVNCIFEITKNATWKEEDE